MRKQVRGIWLPEAEEHLIAHIERGPDFAGAGTYQLSKFQAAFSYTRNFRHAIDVGAHVGLWSRILARCFARLTAFEPIEEHRTCFRENVPSGQGCEIDLQPFALAGADEVLRFAISPESTGGTHVKLEDDGAGPQVVARPLDSFALSQVDFLKSTAKAMSISSFRAARRPCVAIGLALWWNRSLAREACMGWTTGRP